ncbi:hypothetical protein SAMN05216428_102440 [Nitrosospira sp. Nsp11]|uniref:hypothetical protein n=1 Tax=Nitrosospira sp. Nsp11 TaxID=1855338 RepID=UPI00091F6F6D|nr:hypothetical protein [Nitrosospira sp. Nsp11]SHL44957.1 hypothetical protein SAMN05216428_102440 [Nitrosospira sp. Nsp11]
MTGFVYERIAQSLAANAIARMAIAAGELRIAASSYPVTVNLLLGGRILGSASGMQAGDYVRGVPFDGFEIVNGPAAQTVVIRLASGQSGSDRIVGEVSVISGEVTRSASGVAFFAAGGKTAVAAEYSYVLLWNPVASGKRLIANQIMGRVNTSGAFNLRWVSGVIGTFPVGLELPSNKLIGGAATVAEFRAGSQGTFPGTYISGVYSAPSTSFVVPINEPLVINPGFGVLVCGTAPNEQVNGSFQYWEESL